jgi:hypothetical protein
MAIKTKKIIYQYQYSFFILRFKLPHCNPKKWVTKKLPILQWLPKYNMEWAVSDFIAGITVGLTAIPQGIAYALVAHLPAQVRNSSFQNDIKQRCPTQSSLSPHSPLLWRQSLCYCHNMGNYPIKQQFS